MHRVRPLQPRLTAVSRLIAALALFAPLASYAAPSKYKFTDLGAVPDNFIVFTGKGLDVNSKGHVAGASSDPTQIAQIGIPGNGVIDTNATLGGTSSIANAINKSDHLTGISQTTTGEFHAFLWDGIDMNDLGTLGGETSYGLAINNSGQVTGGSETETGEVHAFFWDGQVMHDIGSLGGGLTDGRGISRNGLVTGVATIRNAPDEHHAFIWYGSSIEDIGTLGGPRSSGEAINVHGMVAGQSTLADGTDHAMLWDGEQMIDLGTLRGHQTSIAHSINSNGIVVGSSSKRLGDDLRAFVWQDGAMRALPSPFETTEAWFVNDNGVIFGLAHSSEELRIVRWDPEPRKVAIDIKPGDTANRFNPRSRGNIWVAILSETDPASPFDPLSEVDISTVQFGPKGARASLHRVKDHNRDGLEDLLLRFAKPKTGILCGSIKAKLVGKTYSGKKFAGVDSIRTVGCKSAP